jgi:hypothetical protein
VILKETLIEAGEAYQSGVPLAVEGTIGENGRRKI